MDKEFPLVSVVIPVYKVENYVGACIESVIAQSYVNLEIILIDDGSPDNSGAICDSYAKRDSRIRVIHNENQGVSAARACGVQISHGIWLTFMDSDDTLPNDAVENLVSVALGSNCGIVVGYPNNRTQISVQTLLTPEEYIKGSISGERKIRTGLWGKLFDIRLFRKNEVMYVPREIIQGQDMLVNIKLALANQKDVILIPVSVYNYRNNPSSVMHTFIPTLEYVERHNRLLESYISTEKKEELRVELIVARVNTLKFVTIVAKNTGWKNSSYAKEVLAAAKTIRLPIEKRLLLKSPTLYLPLYFLLSKLYRFFRILRNC